MTSRLIALILVSGCGTPAEKPAPARPQQPTLSSVTLERKPCYGTCPVYLVRVDHTGQVDFTGRANVRQSGNAASRISSDAFARIETAVVAARLDSLPSSYSAGTAACGVYRTDFPTVVLSATSSAGRTQTLRHDLGCSAAPRSLRDLYQLIDSVANTNQWIGPS